MTDAEIEARLPHDLHPYLRKRIALRMLRPVELGSPEWQFVISLLYVVSLGPEDWPSRWPTIEE